MRPQWDTNGYDYFCQRCQSVIPFAGYIQWDVTAQQFVLLCHTCSEYKESKDAQFRNTEFAFAKKLQ